MIKDNITLAEIQKSVEFAVELCFEDGEYLPYMRDFAVWYSIVVHCTDMITAETSVEDGYAIVSSSDLRRTLFEYDYISRLHNVIDEAIDIKIQKYIRNTRIGTFVEALLECAMNDEAATSQAVNSGDDIGGQEG